MNKIPASILILCIVKLQEFCYKYGYFDYSSVADLFIESCEVDGNEINTDVMYMSEIRNQEPFLSLDLSQEKFVYLTFKELKTGI